jgi:hypothetical protein
MAGHALPTLAGPDPELGHRHPIGLDGAGPINCVGHHGAQHRSIPDDEHLGVTEILTAPRRATSRIGLDVGASVEALPRVRRPPEIGVQHLSQPACIARGQRSGPGVCRLQHLRSRIHPDTVASVPRPAEPMRRQKRMSHSADNYRLAPCARTVAVIHASASAVSTRYEYVLPEQMALATNELTARTMLVPPSRLGPPESPKQVPPFWSAA